MDSKIYGNLVTVASQVNGTAKTKFKRALEDTGIIPEQYPEEVTALIDYLGIPAPEAFLDEYKKYSEKAKREIYRLDSKEKAEQSERIIKDLKRSIENGVDIESEDFQKAVNDLKNSVSKILPQKNEIKIFMAYEEQKAEIPPRKWFIDGMLTVGLALLSAKKGIGKSFFVLQAARRIAVGGTFLGRKTIHSRVLYAVTELDRTAVHERLNIYGDSSPSNLFIRYGWSNGDDGINELETVVREKEIKVVIIDMFSAVLPKDAQTNSYDLTPFLLKWRQAAHRLGVCVVAVWHSGKAEKNDPMSNPIGTTGLVGQADCVLTLDRPRSQQKTKLFIGGNHGKEESVNVWFENMEWSLSSGEEEWQECSPGDRPILNYLRDSNERFSAPEIFAHFEDKPERKTEGATRTALNRLKELKLVDKEGNKWFARTTEQELL